MVAKYMLKLCPRQKWPVPDSSVLTLSDVVMRDVGGERDGKIQTRSEG
jgi:hypothetical protein